MVPRSLQAEGHEVHAGPVWWSLGEEAPGDLFGEEVIVGLGGEITQAPDQSVYPTPRRVVDMHRSSERLRAEIKPWLYLTLLSIKLEDIYTLYNYGLTEHETEI